MKTSLSLIVFACSLVAVAADYYVSPEGNDDYEGSSVAPFLSIDKAITVATDAADIIHVAAGDYATTTTWGPQLKAKLVGEGESREAVTIRSAGEDRTLRLTEGAWLENVTIVGSGRKEDNSIIADKGGSIEMYGGTITNCVIKDGMSSGNSDNLSGGNIYMNGGLIVDCVITNGYADKRAGNLYLDTGIVRHCTISGGTCSNVGGNVLQYNGTLENCTILNGTATNDGGNIRMLGSGAIKDSLVKDGTITANDKKGANIYANSSAKIIRCHLSGGTNEAYDGGSLCVYDSGVVVEDCLIEGSSCGGVLAGTTAHLYNTTIVNNQKYGIWAWTANQVFVNCVIMENRKDGVLTEYSGNLPEHSSAVCLNCATTEGSRLTTNTFETVVYATTADFVDFANGDYHPHPGGALEDAGAPDPRGAEASVTDLDGLTRSSGTIDIGCYEEQKASLTVHVDSASFDGQVFAPASVTFTHSVKNSISSEDITYTYDFGDGTETMSTQEATIQHDYVNPGVYTITIRANNACEEESAEAIYEGYVKIASSIVYVTAGNRNAAFPYMTPETGYAKIEEAVAAAFDGYEIRLGEGVYEVIDQVNVQKAVTLKGLGATPEAVIIRNTASRADDCYHRAMQVDNAGVRVENLTLENGKVANTFGGNLRATAGTVTNCIIRGGLATTNDNADSNAGGAAIELAGPAIISHCVITNNIVQGTSKNAEQTGGAIYLPYESRGGKLVNCLIAYNTYATSGEETKIGAVGIHFYGRNDNTLIENCSIVSNVVTGVGLTDTSAGIYCTSWNAKFFNNVIAGNYDEGKGMCTSVNIDSHSSFANNLTDDAAVYSVNNFAAPLATLFRDFARGNFVPKTGGPLCDQARPSTAAVAASVDLAGQPRVFGKGLDIGCFECQKKIGLAILFR